MLKIKYERVRRNSTDRGQSESEKRRKDRTSEKKIEICIRQLQIRVPKFEKTSKRKELSV